MRMAEELAKRSTCARNQVGTVITNADLTQVLGIGYNGNARGLPNACDGTEPGRCGCFVAGSKVRTDRGDIDIQKVRVGDHVLTHRDRWRPVTELFRHQHAGNLALLYFETGSRSNLARRKTATTEHPFLVRRAGQLGWVAASSLVPGDDVALLAAECSACSSKIPHYRRMCPKCFHESSKTIENRRSHSERMTRANPMRGNHPYDPSRVAIAQKAAQKETHQKVYAELLEIKRDFEAQGWRAIIVDHTVRPDLVLVRGEHVVAVEYDTKLFPTNVAKYDLRPEVRDQYDDIIWIRKQRQTWDRHEDSFVWASLSAVDRKPIDQPVYNLEVEEDHSFVCQGAVVHNCLHSEQNALVKAGAALPGKVMFVTTSPCVMCAKLTINTNVAKVYYRRAYRDPAGLEVLLQGGVETELYDRFRDRWR